MKLTIEESFSEILVCPDERSSARVSECTFDRIGNMSGTLIDDQVDIQKIK